MSNDFYALLARLEDAADKKLSEHQSRRVREAMEAIGYQAAHRITVRIERSANIPKNLYGFSLSMIDEEKEAGSKKTLTQSDWKNDPNCATSEEFSMTMKCIAINLIFIDSIDLCKCLAEGMEGACKKDALLMFLRGWYENYSKLRRDRPDLLRREIPFRCG